MTPLEFLYYIGYLLNRKYSLKKQKQLHYPVISIGNITVGGTGKTPATIAIAEEAKKRGFYPIILTRGYRGKAKWPCLVNAECGMRNAELSNSELRTPNSELYGDEPVLMSERLKDVPVVKCTDRYEGGMFALNSKLLTPNSKLVFILDDGFQHWRLYRDMDIVLIDGLNPFGNRRLLPMGPLREPLNELKRADIFVITKTPLHSPLSNRGIRGELLDKLRNINHKAPVYFSEYRIQKVRDVDGNEYPIEILKDKKVFAFCGIANPESFKQNVLSVSVNLCGFKTYRDHYRYSESDANYIEKQGKALDCDFLITTEKDIVKLRELKIPSNLLYIEIGFDINKEFFEHLFKKTQDNYHQGGEYG